MDILLTITCCYYRMNKVSIILCSYNRVSLLPRAIRSVVRQRYADWELIVVDDGSTDGTRRLMQRYTAADARIIYAYQKNKGLAEARNTGMHIASGDFLCFLDSDDELTPDHVRRRVEWMTKLPSVDFFHGGVKLVGPRSKRFVVDVTDPTKKIHVRHCHIGGTFFFRRTVLRRVKKFRPIPFGEDFDFYRRVEKHCTIKKISDATYVYHLETENRLCDIFTEQLFDR